jgi:hypothetical protein
MLHSVVGQQLLVLSVVDEPVLRIRLGQRPAVTLRLL